MDGLLAKVVNSFLIIRMPDEDGESRRMNASFTHQKDPLESGIALKVRRLTAVQVEVVDAGF